MNKLLKKYWLEIEGREYLPYLGITAYSEEDISTLLREKIGMGIKINSLKVIFSVEDLDPNHVVPNMEEFISRGIWYPKGFK